MVVSAPFNKAGSSAQPFSPGKVNAELAQEGWLRPLHRAEAQGRMAPAPILPRGAGEGDHAKGVVEGDARMAWWRGQVAAAGRPWSDGLR